MVSMQGLTMTLMVLVYLPEYLHSVRVRETEGHIECQGCRDECDKCEYGIAISEQCGVLECRKGPDEHCGGENNAGVCGEGMTCLCERCVGCSIDTPIIRCSKATPSDPCLPNNEKHYSGTIDFGNHHPFVWIN